MSSPVLPRRPVSGLLNRTGANCYSRLFILFLRALRVRLYCHRERSVAILSIRGTISHGDHHVGLRPPREVIPLHGYCFMLRYHMPAPCGGSLLFGGSPKSSAKRLPLKRRGALASSVNESDSARAGGRHPCLHRPSLDVLSRVF